MSAGELSGWCETLYDAKAPELILYGRALGLTHGEAEDVLHETFLALMRRSRLPDNPEHYLVRSYRNQSLNYRRSLWRRLTREWESLRWFEPRGSESADEARAVACLEQLPTGQREVVVLKIWHQYTFEFIGELLEISPNTAAGRYRYALQKLRCSLERTEREYEQHEPVGDPFAILGAQAPLPKT